MDADGGHRLVTYVDEKWFVSTLWRQSSAAFNPCWYYEVMVWAWDAETRKRGDEILFHGEGIETHWNVVRKLMNGGPLGDDDNG